MSLLDWFGSASAWEKNGEITLSGIHVAHFLLDIHTIWGNKKVPLNRFKVIRKHRLTFDSFYGPDVLYQVEQILELRKRKSSKHRLKQLHNQMLEKTWLRSTIEKHPDILDFTQLKRLKFTLKDVQRETLEAYNTKVPKMKLDGFLLGTPPGSGKTLMSIALSICLHADVTIFVVPKNTVTSVWYDGIIEQFGSAVRVWSSVENFPLTTGYDYYIFHYEALDKAIGLANSFRNSKKKSFIAIDESHNLNEISAQRTLKLIELSRTLGCKHTVFATGTPVKALGTEMIPLLRTIDPLFTSDVEERFKQIYGATARRANDILRNRLGLISHKIIESSYMTVPPPIETVKQVIVPKPDRFLIRNIKLEMRAFMIERKQYYQSHMREYVSTFEEGLHYYERTLKNSAQREEFRKYRAYIKIIIEGYDPLKHKAEAKFVGEMEKQKIIPSLPQPLRNRFKDSLSVTKWYHLRVLGEALALVGRRRSECAVELAKYAKLDDIVVNADKKTIIFSSFIPALEAANKYFIEKGFKTLNIYGDSTKNIASIVDQFKKDPDTNPLFGTLQSLAASQTLVVANTAIFLDAPFRDYTYQQAIHRIFRIGQEVQTHCITLILSTGNEANISTRSADILDWSKSQVEAIFGGTSREEAAGIVKMLHLNPPSGMEQLMGVIKKVVPFVR